MIVRNIVSVLGLVALVVGSLFYMGTIGLSVTDDVNVRTAHMTIPHTNGLVSGSRVLFRGVPIGRITDVNTGVDGVKVTWNYKRDYEIPANSLFRVDNLSALGETYLGITPQGGTGPSLQDGATLAAVNITVPATISEFSARFTRLLEQVDSQNVRSIIDEANDGFLLDQAVLGSLSKAGALLEATILSTRGSLDVLLENIQPLLFEGAEISESLAASGDPTKRFLAGVKASALNGAATLAVTSHAPESLNGPTADLLVHLQSFLDEAAPEPGLKTLSDAALPSVESAASQMRTVDLSQLMKTALATAGSGDGLVLRVGTDDSK